MGPSRRGAIVGSWQGRRECPYRLIRARLRYQGGAGGRPARPGGTVLHCERSSNYPVLLKKPWRGRLARAALMANRTIARGSFSARLSVASSASTNQSTSSSERTSGGRILITF